MKRAVLFLIALLAISSLSAQVTDTTVVEKDLSVCYLEVADEDDLNVVEIEEEIEGIKISAHFDFDLGVIAPCSEQILNKYRRNTIQINSTDIFVGDRLNGIDLSLFIPSKLILVKENKNTYIVFEMYNFSYTTVGGGYTYIMIKLDEQNEIDSYKVFEYKKEPIRHNILIDKLDLLFNNK